MATKEQAAVNGAAKSEEAAQAVIPPTPAKPNIVKPVNIILDEDKPEDFYQLRMTNKAMQLIEEMLQINLWQGLGDVGNFHPKHIAIMVWACLLWKYPELTIEDVEQLPGLDIANIFYVITRLDAVVYGHLPAPDPETDEKPDPNASPSAGSNSGQSADKT